MAKCRLCDKPVMPGKVYCRNHVHGNTNNESHSSRNGKLTDNERVRPGEDTTQRDKRIS